MIQLHFIQRIIDALGIQDESKMHDTPTNVILNRDESGKKQTQDWNYRSLIGMMSYLASTPRPGILFPVHQCARFCSCPKRSHEEAVKRIGCYLKRTKDKGMICTFNPTKGIEVFVDTDFVGGWTLADSQDVRSALSRTGYAIKVANCSIC